MKEHWYFVGNTRTGECVDVTAPSEQAACERQGWSIEDCVVIRVIKDTDLAKVQKPRTTTEEKGTVKEDTSL